MRGTLLGVSAGCLIATHLTFPPGILQPGGVYVFSLSAFYGNGSSATPFAGGLPFCQVNATTGVVTP